LKRKKNRKQLFTLLYKNLVILAILRLKVSHFTDKEQFSLKD